MNEQNILFYRGMANFEAGNYDNAIIDFSRYIKEVSDFAETYFNIALCYKQLKEYEKAIEFLTETINKNSLHEAAYFERGLIKNILEDKEGCCNDLKKAMELGHLEAYHYIKELCESGSQ
jgi:tetratricopeptide (TPR) repeat protein